MLRKDPADIDVRAEIGIIDMGPAATIGVGTSVRRRGHEFIYGNSAYSKVVEESRIHNKLCDWFLTCLIKGLIQVNEQSTADGFIPLHVQRKKEGGILFDEKMPIDRFYRLVGAQCDNRKRSSLQKSQVWHCTRNYRLK